MAIAEATNEQPHLLPHANGRKTFWASLCVDVSVASLFLVGIALFFSFTADDAFIVFRYARNLVEHGEWTFNRGEPVAALTSPLHGLLASLLCLVFGDSGIEVSNKLFGSALVLSSALFMSRRLYTQGSERLLFCGLSLLSPFTLLWTVGGLETPLLASLVAVAVTLHVTVRETPSKSPHLVALLCATCCLSFLTRADSSLFLAPLLIEVFWSRRRQRHLWASVLSMGLVVVAWFAFATVYYHDPLPTSAYVKLGRFTTPFAQNFSYTHEFLLFSGMAPLLLWLVCRSIKDGLRGTPWRFGWAWMGLALFYVYSFTHSAQHMFFGFRCFVPYLSVLAAVGVDALKLRRRAAGLLLVAMLLPSQALLAWHMYTRGLSVTWTGLFERRNSREYDDVSVQQYTAFIAQLKHSAAFIRKHWQSRGRHDVQPRIAVYTGGVPPYLLPEFYVLEMLVSYRHRCRVDHFLQAHYAQFLRIGPTDQHRRDTYLADAATRSARTTELVYRGEFRFAKGTFLMDVVYHPEPRPLTIPRRVNEPCASEVGGSER